MITGTKTFRAKSGALRAALLSAVLASFAATAAAQAQEFPPFPEPAVGPFPDTRNMEFLAQLTPDEIGAVTPRGSGGLLLSDIWGWTSPNGEDYALVGTGNGMSVVRVTDPRNPQFIGQVPTTAPLDDANLWGDVGLFNVRHDDDGEDFTGYAYYTTEAEGAGINILELNQLDEMSPADPGFEIMPSGVFEDGGYVSAHNVYVNEETGFAYVVGVELAGEETACDGEPFTEDARFHTLILDLNPNPLNPVIVACRADAGEHDIYVVNYNGPDKDYRGREIAFVFDGRDKDAPSRRGTRTDDTPGELVGGTTEIWDVTDKHDIKVISSFVPEGLCFSHAGWTSSNQHEFLLINDELDEPRDADDPGIRAAFCQSDAEPTTTNPGVYVMNIRDLDAPFLQERFEIDAPGDNDHNFIREGNKLYWAVYSAGTSVLKMTKKKGRLALEEIGRLDTEPRMPGFFGGQWGVFPFKSSETIVASDVFNGLVVMSLAEDRDDDDLRIAAGTATTASQATAASQPATATVATRDHILR
jgi:choice-of-anchor B domain-containing protein